MSDVIEVWRDHANDPKARDGYAHIPTSDLRVIMDRLTTAERERDEARRVVERIKAIRLSPLCCDGENNAEVDAYHDGFNAAMEEVHEAVRALDAAEGTA